MYSQLYTAMFILSFIALAGLVAFFKDRISVYYVLLYAGVLYMNFGYAYIVEADSLQTALLANRVTYLAACFVPFFLMMCLADLCKIEVREWQQHVLVVFGIFVFAMVSTIGKNGWYYESVSLSQANGLSVLEKTYGPMHSLYPLYLLVVLICCGFIVIRAFRRREDVSYINTITLLAILVVNIIAYSLEKILRLKAPIMPVAYVIGIYTILYLLQRISLYDVEGISTDAMVESDDFGFVLLDSNGKYLGSDVAAKKWFPEIRPLIIDTVAKEKETELFRQIDFWMSGEDERDIVYIKVGEYVIEATHKILSKKRSKSIHCIYLRDDTKQHKYTELVERFNEKLEKDVEAKTERMRNIQNDIIISMASIVENRDNNTGGHIARTSDIMKIFVKHLQTTKKFPQLTRKISACIIKAAPLHDFGKIAIPDVILNKPGKFTDDEYEKMKEHSAKGAVIVKRILENSDDETFKTIAVNVAHYHHERWDGKGYPNGIGRYDIPFEARVMALADVFDALVSKRVYKERFSYDKAFSIIEESSGTQFDPVLCKEFLACRDKLERLYDSYTD